MSLTPFGTIENQGLLEGGESVLLMGRASSVIGQLGGASVFRGHEVLGAWLAKESVRDVYLTSDPGEAAMLLDKTIAGCRADGVPEVRSLGRTLAAWRTEILAYHSTGASNGPTEGLNLLVKKVKRCGHGFRSFENYRLRVLLHTGGIKWQTCTTARLRTRSPHLDA